MKQYKNVCDWQQHTTNILGQEQGEGIQPEYTAQMMLLMVSVSEDHRTIDQGSQNPVQKSSEVGFYCYLYIVTGVTGIDHGATHNSAVALD